MIRINKSSLFYLLLTNFLLGIGVFYLLGAQFKEIGFHSDDYGLIRHGAVTSLHDIKRIFKNGDIMHSSCFSSENLYPYGRPSCMEVIYRPLLLLIMGAEHRIFGLNPYATHLIHIGLHTLLALTLFNLLFYFFSSIPLAMLGSLFFAFHTSLKDYFFWQCYIQKSLEGFFFLLLVGFLYLFLKTSHHRWGLSSGVILFLSLLLRETLFIWPLMAAIGWLFARKTNLLVVPFSTFIRRYLGYTFISLIGYFSLRCWAYPFSSTVQRIGIKPLGTSEGAFTYLRNKFYDVLTYWFDVCGLKWIPGNNLFLKLALIATITGTIIYFFIKSNSLQRALFILFSVSIFLSSWPSLLFFHSSRYLYLPSLFTALLLGLVIHVLCRHSIFIKMVTYSFLTLFIAVQAYISIKTMESWCRYNYREMTIHQELSRISHTTNKPIIALGTPLGIIRTGSCSRPIVVGAKKESSFFHQFSPHTAIGNYLTLGLLFRALLTGSSIELPSLIFKQAPTGLEIKTRAPANVWFEQEVIASSSVIGETKILDKENNKITHFSINFKPSVIHNNLVVGWLHAERKFIPLN